MSGRSVEHPSLTPSRPVAAAPSLPAEHAVLSAVLPGLGQWAQGRMVTGFTHMGTAVALSMSDGYGPWLAIAVCVWSSIDAWRSE